MWTRTKNSIVLVGRQVALGGDLADDLAVLVLVEVMAVGVEDAVAPQTERLMKLEIKTDRSHSHFPVNDRRCLVAARAVASLRERTAVILPGVARRSTLGGMNFRGKVTRSFAPEI